jgi:hypothetical protein
MLGYYLLLVPLFVAVDHEGGPVRHARWVTPQPAAAPLVVVGAPSPRQGPGREAPGPVAQDADEEASVQEVAQRPQRWHSTLVDPIR